MSKSRRDQLRNSYLEKYGKRGKSRWVCEAVLNLLQADPMLEMVGIGDALEPKECVIPVVITPIEERLLEAVRLLRNQSPMIEGPMALIIRSAIRRELDGRGGEGA